MNGVSVSPGQNLQNAPTWQVENTARKRAFLAFFWHSSYYTKKIDSLKLTQAATIESDYTLTVVRRTPTIYFITSFNQPYKH